MIWAPQSNNVAKCNTILNWEMHNLEADKLLKDWHKSMQLGVLVHISTYAIASICLN